MYRSRHVKAAIANVSSRCTPAAEPLLFLYPRWAQITASHDVGRRRKHTGTSPAPAQVTASNESATISEHIDRDELKVDSQPLNNGLGKWPVRGHAAPQAVSQRELESPAKQIFRKVASATQIERANRNRAKWKDLSDLERRSFQAQRMSSKQLSQPNWRQALQDLVQTTPRRSTTWHTDAARIHVPASFAWQLIFNLDNNIWNMKERHGCQIDLLESIGNNADTRTLRISGPAASVAGAASEVLEMARSGQYEHSKPGSSLPHISTHGSRPQGRDKSGAALPRYVKSGQRKLALSLVSPQGIQKPEEWTPESFGMYIERLTQHKVLSDGTRPPGDNDTHDQTVLKAIKEAFIDPKARSSITVTAINDAIIFMTKRRMISDVRILYVQMEVEGIRMNTDTFNAMMSGAAKTRDLYNFMTILALMLRRGYTPNPKTWVTFLQTVDDAGIQAHILHEMERKGLMQDSWVKRRVTEIMVGTELEQALSDSVPNLITLTRFFDRMSERYGSDWATQGSIEAIIQVLGKRGDLSLCWAVIEQSWKRYLVKPSAQSIEMALGYCKALGNADAAVDFMQLISSTFTLPLSERMYAKLFSIAWSRRLFAFAAVVWRFACLNAKTSYSMRKRLADNLIASVRKRREPKLDTERWKDNAGIFILGPASVARIFNRPLLQEQPKQLSLDADTKPDPKPSSTTADAVTTPLHVEVEDALLASIIDRAIRESQSLYQHWRPNQDFATILAEALAVDRKYTLKRRAGYDDALSWLADNLPRVTAVPRRSGGSGARSVSWEDLCQGKRRVDEGLLEDGRDDGKRAMVGS